MEVRPNLNGILFNQISYEDVIALERPFSEEEVREVIWNCVGEKIPGPNGFNLGFFKFYWTVLRIDILDFVNEFHEFTTLPKAVMASFIALIPKVDNSLLLDEY